MRYRVFQVNISQAFLFMQCDGSSLTTCMEIAVAHESHNLSHQKPGAPDKSQASNIRQTMIIYHDIEKNSGSLHRNLLVIFS